MFEGLSRGGLDTHVGRDSRQDNAGHPAAAELQIKVCPKKCAPLPLATMRSSLTAKAFSKSE
jgi:hypothetical protein